MRHYEAGYSLLATLLSSAIGMLLCGTAIHFLCITINTYNKVQQKFASQHARLMARHILGADLITAAKEVRSCTVGIDICSHLITPSIQDLILQKKIKTLSDLLILQTNDGTIIYYLRRSILSKPAPNSFALYRDDITNNAIAIAEDLQNFKVQITNFAPEKSKISIEMQFVNNIGIEFSCILRQ